MTIRRRLPESTGRPWLTRGDLAFAAELPLLAILALVLPERRWRRACQHLEALKARLRFFDPAAVARTAAHVLGPSRPDFDATRFALESAAGRSEHHLQILRAAGLRSWKPKLALEGTTHLDEALAAGHGAVLWVAHFCFNALATKVALAQAGYGTWHLSRPEHGFSKSRVGIATVNRIRVRAELAHLAGRIVIDREKPMAATLAAQRILRRNGIVSITAGAWEGTRLADVALLGGTLALALGAPGLARLAGAPLLPVFTLRGADDVLRVIVESPIAIARGDADAALDAAAQRFGERLEDYVRRHPSQWRDWKALKV
jgi:lauroyl/myristoyl acyltransferase